MQNVYFCITILVVLMIFPNSNVIWNLYGFHMGTHVAYIWFAHMGFTLVFHLCVPYGTHIEPIWFAHVTPIWVVGCKPHEIPYVCHMSSHMEPI